MDTKSFGVILSVKMSDFDLDKEIVINAFIEAGFEEKFHPKERMSAKAFRKALSESIEGETDFMVRPVIKDGTIMACGLVKEQKDSANKDLIYDVCNVLTLNSEMGTIHGKSDFRTDSIIESYKDNIKKLGATEISQKLKEIFFMSMAIKVLCEKAIFIPNKFKENIDKVSKLFDVLIKNGAKIDLEVIGVDCDTQTRNTIVRQFTEQTMASLDEELTFCLEQRQKFQDGTIKYLRPKAFRNQLAKVKTLEERIKTYIVVLELTSEEDKAIWEKLELLDTEISKNIELATSSVKKGKTDKSALANL